MTPRPEGSSCVLGVELLQRRLEIVLRQEQIVDVERRGHDFAVQRRHENLDTLTVDTLQGEDMLLAREVRASDRRSLGRAYETVDDFIDAGSAERSGRRATEKATPCEAHQLSGRTSTRPASSLSRLLTTMR